MKLKLFTIFLIINFFIKNYQVKSQNEIEKLKREKAKIESEIKESEKILNQIKNRKLENERYLEILNENIKNREKRIEIIEKEIKEIEKNIENLNENIKNRNIEIERLIKNYIEIICRFKKMRIKENFLIFIIASENLNDAYKKIIYLKKINDKVKEKKKKICQEINNYKNLKNLLENKKEEKLRLINELNIEKKNIEIRKEEVKNILLSMKTKEEEIKKNIEKRRKELEKLRKEIEKIISAEVRKKDAEKNVAKGEMLELDKGSYDWPVKYGIIVNKHGIQKHSLLKNVTVKNYGIDISTTENSDAYSIFNGEIKKIFIVPGYNIGVIINNGEYYSVYMNLEKVYVKEGQKINKNQAIGKIFTDKEKNETILHFQIWKNMENLNPEEWLKKKN